MTFYFWLQFSTSSKSWFLVELMNRFLGNLNLALHNILCFKFYQNQYTSGYYESSLSLYKLKSNSLELPSDINGKSLEMSGSIW